MNLCGAIIDVPESELLLEMPNEHFAAMDPSSTRRKSTPSSRRSSSSRKGVPTYVDTSRRTPTGSKTSSTRPSSSRSSRSHHSPSVNKESPHNRPSPTFLNPISRDDFKRKSRSRQRTTCPPLHNLKMTSGLIKKVEEGFYVNLIADDGSKREVTLDLDPDRKHLRIRGSEKDSDDNENDGSQSNQAEIRLRVKDIARLEVGRDRSSQKDISESSKPVKCFSILTKSVSESNSFNFEADSRIERDVIVSSIRGLIDHLKYPLESRRHHSHSPAVEDGRKKESVSKRTQNRDSSSSHVRSEVIQTPKTPGEEGLEASIVYFDFEVSEERNDPAIEAETERSGKFNHNSEERNETSESASDTEERISPESSSEFPSETPNKRALSRVEKKKEGSKDEPRGTSEKEPRDSRELAITVVKSRGMRDLGIEVSGNDWSVDDILCGFHSAKGKHTRRHENYEDGQVVEASSGEKERTIEEIKESLLYDSVGCNAWGCHSQALAAVEDVELAAMANQQVSAGPWCTDDVVTEGLKDFADSMKEIFEIKQKPTGENQTRNEQQRAMAEDYITGVLGVPSTMVSLLSVKDMWNTAVAKHSESEISRVENRASVTGAQATRLKSLRNQMTFNAADQHEKMPFMQIITSFDDIERTGRKSKKAGKHGNSENENDDVLYYDSDPEDVRERTFKRGPRRAQAERDNTLDGAKPARRSTLSDIPMSRLGINRRYKKMDEEVMTEIITAMKNEQMTLMWHPTQTKMDRNRTPVCVKVWIEAGTYLVDGTFLLPKLTWVPAHEENLHHKILNVSQESPGTLDLLDVCRVRECDVIDRQLHPFANVELSFTIQTQSGVCLFETRSKEERGRVVIAFKLVIARLASLLMLRDLRAVDEFFGGNSVPGEAPSWAKGKNENGAPGEEGAVGLPP